MTCSPVALFVYNRPEHTRKTVEALQKNALARDSDLIIFSDAPKTREQDEAVRAVRKLIRTLTGFKSIEIIEREQNLGLDPSILDGVTRLCNQYGKAIVLEDDLVVSSEFLLYMNQSLNHFENEHKVMQISGHMFSADLPKGRAILLPFTTSWGWGVWKRSWDMFDQNSTGYTQLNSNMTLRYKFDLEGAYPYYKLLNKVISGKGDHWDIRWYLSVFIQQGLILYPPQTLVENIGFDGSGMNCGVIDLNQCLLNDALMPVEFPTQIEISESYEKVIAAIRKMNRVNHLLKIKTYFSHFFKLMQKVI